ncbi:hypothetical protein [Arthrobacter sp. Soil763]|uniref:hypothetical protein n=1 Tax=Arthrobacter sp. Soil763 TaxID=1736402 RepID=UPI0007022AE8|nr:hypothetical protein [Arthrobacter sp. Soil763]KRE79950.1 hypothetical protein ASG71_07910 [Arthrobacter sp. Soil763]
MRVYATPADLQDWIGQDKPLPANAAGLLRSASLLVEAATITAVYDTDADGKPTASAVADAFRDATTAQAAMWSAAGIDPAGGGVASSAPVSSKKLGSGAISYDTSVNASVTAFEARRAATTTLCMEAWLILQQVGLV